MKNKITKTETKTFEVVESVTCDLCGRKGGKHQWESSDWNVNETQISVSVRHKEGDNYPDGGQGTKIDVDICPECFKSKLVPWLRSQGAMIKEEKWDW